MIKNVNFNLLIWTTALIVLVPLTYFIITNNNLKSVTNTNNYDRIQIVTSFYPLYFFASQIALNNAEIHNITPAGAEPHDYEPTARDMANIENSKLLIVNGGKFEGWTNSVKSVIDDKKTLILNIQENLTNQNTIRSNEELQDPHYWLSPVLAKEEIILIRDNLIAVDPNNANYYNINSKILLDKLEALNIIFKTELSRCEKKDIITSHSAFGYLARQYGFNQISISGLSPDEEPSAKKLIEVASFAKNNNVNYIFFESLVSPKLSNTIAREIGAKTLVLNPIEGLTDSEIAHGENYFTVMQDNLTNLKLALQCL